MIKFGTDGWRGLIARDFTFENLQYVALATARYIKNTDKDNLTAVVGYDTRFLSRQFAEEVSKVLAWQGIVVHLTQAFATTPEVSFHTKQKGAAIGVMITASHNPPEYNGFKIKANFGGPATPDQVAEVEKYLRRILQRPPEMKFKDLDLYIDQKKIRLFDPKESYLRHLRKKIDIAAIEEHDFKVLYDPMYGAAIGKIFDVLPSADEIHGEYNPAFGSLSHPEPIGEELAELMQRVKDGGYDVGFAADGDADRLGAVDENGNFVDSHRIFMILLKYLYEKKKKRGAVAKTVSLTSMVDKYCKKKKIKLIETPVGFKHIAKLMNEENILIGGEESGGLGTTLHIPERDGLFNALLVLEVMVKEGKTLGQLCDDLDEEFGVHRFERRDQRVTQQQKKTILDACEKKPTRLGRFEVTEINDRDGYKFFVDGGWLLIRASGTEPLIRFYAEADSLGKVNELLDEGMKLK
ncbi:MAG: phosphoglucomutase/phosphomannomutase family protein [Candidatus Kapaibacterium sp.]